MEVCGRDDVELLDFLPLFIIILLLLFLQLWCLLPLLVWWQMASSGVPSRGPAPLAPQLLRAGGRGWGWHPTSPLSTSPGLREQRRFALASRAAPLSLSQTSLNSCFTRSAFPIHWEKINKSNPQDLPLITSRLYLGLQLSCALL